MVAADSMAIGRLYSCSTTRRRLRGRAPPVLGPGPCSHSLRRRAEVTGDPWRDPPDGPWRVPPAAAEGTAYFPFRFRLDVLFG